MHPIIVSSARLRDQQFCNGRTPASFVGRSVAANILRPFTRARIDEKLFGLHTGITLRGTIIELPKPMYLGNPGPHLLTMRGNPWYMAPGWMHSRRYVDTRFRLAGFHQPKLFVNPWDHKFGTIGSYLTKNLEAIRANQMGEMSFT